jgi:carboxymethylenebutenolidase
MHEKDISVVTRHGRMPTFTVHPEGAGPHPVVILYMDAPGIREELRDMARRIAARGYYCACPTSTTGWAPSASTCRAATTACRR